jgi:hypothetical protein
MAGARDGSYDGLPPAATITRSSLPCGAAAVPKCSRRGVLALLAQVPLAGHGISGSDTRPIILVHQTLCRAARKWHEADLGPSSASTAEADLP